MSVGRVPPGARASFPLMTSPRPAPDPAEARCNGNPEPSVLIRPGNPAAQHKIHRQAQRDRTNAVERSPGADQILGVGRMDSVAFQPARRLSASASRLPGATPHTIRDRPPTGVLDLGGVRAVAVSGPAGDDQAGSAGGDDAGEGVQDHRGAQQVDLKDPFDGCLGRGDPGGVDDLGDRAQGGCGIGQGFDGVVVADVGDARAWAWRAPPAKAWESTSPNPAPRTTMPCSCST